MKKVKDKDEYISGVLSIARQSEYAQQKHMADFLFEAADYLKSIKEQPKIGEWIPCSERLPEEEGWYLETVVCGSVKRTGFGLFKNGIWKHFDDEIETIAWQPLPDSYRKDVE